MTEELKPCPFCGGEAEIRDEHDHSWIAHKGCPADLGGFETRVEAIVAWNRRTTLSGRAEPFGYYCECKGADPAFLRKPAYIPPTDNLHTTTPLYAAPFAILPDVSGAEAVGWETEAEWELEQRAFHWNEEWSAEETRKLIHDLWREYCLAAEPAPDTIVDALSAWRDTRKATIDVDVSHEEYMTRLNALSEAEHRLMKLAEKANA